jgi:hypothetical protein
MANLRDSWPGASPHDGHTMETTFVISLIGTLLWLSGLWWMARSLRLGTALHLLSTVVFAVLNIQVGAYPGLVGAVVGMVIMVRTIRRARPKPGRTRPRRQMAFERVWAEAPSPSA